MRVLLATTANDGHFGPLAPFARACRSAGHEVRVAAPASYAAALRRSGVDTEPGVDTEAVTATGRVELLGGGIPVGEIRATF